MPSTDSTLSEILKSTEKRLQEGGTTGVAERNRASLTQEKGSSRGRTESVASLTWQISFALSSLPPEPNSQPDEKLAIYAIA